MSEKAFPQEAFVVADGEGDDEYFLIDDNASDLLADGETRKIARYKLVDVRSYTAKVVRKVTSKEIA